MEDVFGEIEELGSTSSSSDVVALDAAPQSLEEIVTMPDTSIEEAPKTSVPAVALDEDAAPGNVEQLDPDAAFKKDAAPNSVNYALNTLC